MSYTLYNYVCPDHGEFNCATRADHTTCHISMSCVQKCQRRWGFTVGPSFQPHYNPSLGVAVNSRSQLQSEFSRASDKASAPGVNYLADGTEIPINRPVHNFVPIDARDKEALGVTNDGLDATYDAWKSQGRDDDAKRLKALMDDS